MNGMGPCKLQSSYSMAQPLLQVLGSHFDPTALHCIPVAFRCDTSPLLATCSLWSVVDKHAAAAQLSVAFLVRSALSVKFCGWGANPLRVCVCA